MAPDLPQKIIGIRPGEKIHEVLLSDSDSRNAIEYENYFIVKPEFKWWSTNNEIGEKGTPVEDGFSYSSDNNKDWLNKEQLVYI